MQRRISIFLAAGLTFGTMKVDAQIMTKDQTWQLLRALEPAPPSPQTSQVLPLRQVALFSSGVGYFERAGQISGGASVDLSFRNEQVNDILKSLVLFDPAGQVRPVTYTTQDALARRLRSLGVNVGSDVSLGQLLRQFQGARVQLQIGNETIEGRILSVSAKQMPFPTPLPMAAQNVAIPIIPAPLATIEVLNISTVNGLRAIPLDAVTQIKLLDARLDQQLRENLELSASSLDDQHRAVTLNFGAGGSREVRAGYLQEMPVWKTSYRLVADKAQKPFLQGWAIVENTSEDDWQNVRLSLISGRPISFIQDLATPLYVPRPVVAPQVIGSPLPQTYGEAIESEDKRDGAPLNNRITALEARPAPDRLRKSERGGGGGGAGFSNSGNFNAPAKSMAFPSSEVGNGMLVDAVAKSAASQAAGSERGELFEYAIRQPISLSRGQAAMVPIVSENIEGEKLSIFDPASNAQYALNGFRLKNSSGLHLAGGPITVFTDGIYAGDGQINNVGPGEERLISYAVDLELVTSLKTPNVTQQDVSFVAKSGVLTITRRQSLERVYSFRNKSEAPKTVLIQQPMDNDFTLIEPAKAYEKSSNEYRFRLEVPAGKTVEFKTLSQRPISESIALLDVDFDALTVYARGEKVSPRLRAALENLVSRRRNITDLQTRRANLEAEVKTIFDEQSRIRQNMAQLNRDNDLYKQYTAKLTAEEARIETLREQIARLKDQEDAAQKELRAFVDNLTTE